MYDVQERFPLQYSFSCPQYKHFFVPMRDVFDPTSVSDRLEDSGKAGSVSVFGNAGKVSIFEDSGKISIRHVFEFAGRRRKTVTVRSINRRIRNRFKIACVVDPRTEVKRHSIS
jgi:hypothetical protein